MAVPAILDEQHDLRTLVDQASSTLANARTAAEVLEARDMAGLAYDAAKRAARLQKAKQAHDDLIAAAHRAQAHALEIEAQAKQRLADEYDAAQQRGEVGQPTGRPKVVSDGNDFSPPTAAELGLSRKEVHEARRVRDAERAEPGIVRRTLDDRLDRGEESTRAALRRAVAAKLDRALTKLKAAEEEHARISALPKAPPLSEEEKACQIRVFGTQEDRAIVARLYEIVERIAEQPTPAEAVRRIPPASVPTVEIDPIRRAAGWLEDFCSIFEKEAPDGIEAAE
jgi:hypothetical protein